MPAVIEFDSHNILIRIEILYLQHELRADEKTILAGGPNHNSKIVLQVGDGNPVSLILWLENLYAKQSRHIACSAWLLIDTEGQAIGIEVVLET